jgi:predicted helicase
MPTINLKPEHKAVKEYYSQLDKLTTTLNAKTEGAVAPLFANLLRHCASQAGLTLIEQFSIKRPNQTIRVDGAIVDEFKLSHGIWEAKDTADDLAAEIKKKVEKGYPKDNILFQAPRRAVLYQDGSVIMDADLTKPDSLIEILKCFFEYEPPAYDQWTQAVEEFKIKVPELGEGLLKLIDEQRKLNPEFLRALDDFTHVVQESINPNISIQAVQEMLIQHILTERLFRTIFDNPDFATRNVIAIEIEKVVRALTARSFSRSDFLKSLDRFYGAIETTASTIDDYSQKQAFLNIVYEKFFQGFSIKAADIYGIVYTPQPIVNFMVKSVEHILKEEFGRSIADDNVHIIDPFVGTGNFITNIMQHIPKTRLPYKYANELHCNEVMLLPYYIASMNIEHAYMDLTGSYAPFDGICLVDTFEVTEQMSIFGHENTQRIAKQRNAPIFVVIANPPYNAKQVNENDNNKKRLYHDLDKRVADSYVKDSKAQNNNAVSDVYVKAFKWASDRIKDEGIIAFITNNGFLDGYAFDGMRKHLEKDFSKIIHVNLKGNARTSGERRQREAGNIFDDAIRVGVGITFLIRKAKYNVKAEITYYEVDDYLKSSQKKEYLENSSWFGELPDSKLLSPDIKHTWLTEGLEVGYSSFNQVGSRESTNKDSSLFQSYCRGVETTRDFWVYNFCKNELKSNINAFIDFYNFELDRWKNRNSEKITLDQFLSYDETKIKWSSDLYETFKQHKKLIFNDGQIGISVYRPFCKNFLYFDKPVIHRPALWAQIFPNKHSHLENLVICFSAVGNKKPFHTLLVNSFPDLHLTGDSQCFPFYTYSEDSSNRSENITDWALEEYRKQYKDPSITKWDIFYYVYGFLHHPGYRTKYAANLRRELPRLPFAPNFWAFSRAGKRLAEIHVNYENQPEYPLIQVETPGKPLDWRVQKMKLSPDKTALIYNDFLSLTGIPLEVYNYKLGNRSALEWIVDQYRVKTDPRSGITNDPNDPDKPDYIVNLIKKIVTVSLETVEIVNALPEAFE